MIVYDRSKYRKKEPIKISTVRNEPLLKSTHTYETRPYQDKARGEHYTDEMLVEIIELAYSKGLSSFRDKGPVTISFMDENRNTCAVLVEITRKNIFIITMFNSNDNKPWNFIFRETKNRINLWREYTLRALTDEEHSKVCDERFNYFKKHAPKIIRSKKNTKINNGRKPIKKVKII